MNAGQTAAGRRVAMIMAGGTGGHVLPGLAVAAELARRGWHVVWVGNPDSMESRLVPAHGFPIRWVRFSGLRGKGLKALVLLPFTLLRAFWQSLLVLREERPAVVLGMGGYVAFPGAMMAVLLGRPLVIHEQNSVAGLTNRVLARIAERSLVAFPGVLPGAQHCGNPVRTAVLEIDPPAERFAGRSGPLRILVVGGSQGAAILNEVVPQALELIAPQERPAVLHQCGRGKLELVEGHYRAAGVAAEVREFIDDIDDAYADADLVVCRAGAMTIAELAVVGVASVLVPFPHAVDDHQSGNARFLSEAGAAVLVAQGDLSAPRLAQLLRERTRAQLLQMAESARKLARREATDCVADACEAVAKDQ